MGYSERRICRAIGQGRSSQHYRRRIPDDENSLIEEMHRLALQWPRFGYRRIAALLRQDGWRVNVKRVHRLWKSEGLQIRGKARKRRRLGNSSNACHRRKALHKDHVWGYDFVSDRTEGGRPPVPGAVTVPGREDCYDGPCHVPGRTPAMSSGCPDTAAS